MTINELHEVLRLHSLWLRCDKDGVCADLRGAYFHGAYLHGANLSDANLRGAYLSGAVLSGADLRGANLCGANLRRADLSGAYLSGADLSRADLRGADLSGANFSRADLSRADLSYANLSGADLRDADLRDADLRDANLRGAYLRGAKGITFERISPLALLNYQSIIRLFKLAKPDGSGPYFSGLICKIGAHLSVDNASIDKDELCGPGVNVATLDWCLKEYKPDYRIFIVEFNKSDIACIPSTSDGKLRLHRCTVVDEISQAEIQRMLS